MKETQERKTEKIGSFKSTSAQSSVLTGGREANNKSLLTAASYVHRLNKDSRELVIHDALNSQTLQTRQLSVQDKLAGPSRILTERLTMGSIPEIR